MPTPVTPTLIRELGYAVTTDVMNRKEAIAIDRRALPLLDFTWGRRKTDAGQAGSKTRVNLKVAGSTQLQGWNGRDVLGFQGNEIDLTMEFEFYNIHSGLEFVHTDLLDMGYTVMYNESRTKNFAKRSGPDEINRLANLFEEKVETHFDNWKVLMDQIMHYSTDPMLPPGLDQLISITPTIGTIGGKDRASNPLLQNVGGTLQGVDLNTLDCSGNGDLFRGLTIALRQANIYGRGRSARVDRMFAGSKFLDGHSAFRQRTGTAHEGLRVQAGSAAKMGKQDMAILDTEHYFAGLPIEFDPTLDLLDQIGTPDNGVPFSCRCYGIASKAFEVRCPPKMDMQVSFPVDPPDQRFTRMSTDSRCAPVVTVPNAHFVLAVDLATV
jgi:hypothetical protein